MGFDLCEGDLEPTGLSVGHFCLAYYFLEQHVFNKVGIFEVP